MNDPTNSEQVEAVDHRARAERLLDHEPGVISTAADRDRHLPRAHVEATLALVDEVAKLREALAPREHGWTGPDILRGGGQQ